MKQKNLNRQVKRNINRFPEEYGGRRYLPYAFTEYGITMLAGILKSDIAIKMSIRIVDTFINMRKYISDSIIEQKYINNLVLTHENNFKEVYQDIKLLQESFDKLEENKKINELYFEGQIYDAYSKILDIFKIAKKELIIIDSYAEKQMRQF